MRIRGYYLVVTRWCLWRLNREMPEDFWGWIYKRVSDSQSRDCGNKILVWLLFKIALAEEEPLRIAALYERYPSYIDELPKDEYRRSIEESLDFKRNYYDQQ